MNIRTPYFLCSLIKYNRSKYLYQTTIVKSFSSGFACSIVHKQLAINHQPSLIYCNRLWKRNDSTLPPEGTFVSGGHLSDSIFLKLSNSEAVCYVQKLLCIVHDSSGLPWWGAIALTTLILRSIISFPLGVYQAYISAKVENISLIDMPEIAKSVQRKIGQKANECKWTEKEANYNYKYELKTEWDKLIVAQNCHPVKATLPIWFQLPTWICFSAALRNLAYMMPHYDADAKIRYLELSLGGFLWVPNLTIPDSSFIFPVILGISNLIIIEIQCMMRMREATRAQRYATNFFRGFSIILVPISSTVPSCVCIYWAVSSLLGLCQNLILMSNRVKSGFGIPETPSTLDRPYAHLAHEIALKLRLGSNR